MKFVATKFGQLNFQEEEIIVLPKGILGFSQLTRYILLENEGRGPFKWLQSVEDPNVAFVIADPLDFFPNYKMEIDE
jgi:flagellar assembly factor FliW